VTSAVVGGALANKAGYGGEAWIRMSWVVGLRRLGIDAWLVEDIDSATCTDRLGSPAPARDSYNRAYFDDVVAAFGLTDRAVLRVVDSTKTGADEIYGAGAGALAALREEAELVVNIGGHLPAEVLFPRARRVYVDIDPGWTQYWHASGNPGARLCGHHALYTIAENLGTARCPIPTGGLAWRTIRQPVVLADWPVVPGPGSGRFTTVATWRNSFGPVGALAGSDGPLGAKHHEFRRFVDLARDSTAVYELALRVDAGDAADRELLATNGWLVVDAAEVARTPADFQAYVQGSGAEFSPVQGVYAHTSSGWFSDRSLRYLASGRPVLVQDTGLADHLPVGEGLVTFDSLAGARVGEARIRSDYDAHAVAARAIAERYFDSDVVLSRLLDEVGVS
jgi:hypothetical protein